MKHTTIETVGWVETTRYQLATSRRPPTPSYPSLSLLEVSSF